MGVTQDRGDEDSLDFDPASYDSMQDYAREISGSSEVTDSVVNNLAKGLESGVHDSSSEDVFDEHSTVRYGDGTLHYDDESGAWRDFGD